MRTLRNYYRVTLPGDLYDNIESLSDYAINEARERARLFCIPCNWTSTHVSGQIGDHAIVFRVCRTRRRP